MRFLAILVVLLLACGCTATVGRQDPLPNVALVTRLDSMRLVIPAGVPERLEFDVPSVEVDDWRTTLRSGFLNGFGLAYRVGSGADANLTLTLDEVRLEIGDFDHSWARIQYKATLADRAGTIRRSAGVVVKPHGAFESTTSAVIAADVRGAVEAMYEQIAKDLLAAV